jgi:hypothetical protein
MKLRWIVVLVLAGLVALVACNKQKQKSLDYTEDFKAGTYHPVGLPGEGHVGASPEDMKASGYDPKAATKPDEKKPDASPAPQPAEQPKAPESKPSTPEEPKNP